MDVVFFWRGKRPELAHMKKPRLKLILTGLLVLFAIWMVWPETKTAGPSEAAENDPSRSGRNGWNLLGFGRDEKESRDPQRVRPSDDSGLQRIDRLINHEALSNREVAEQLLLIAKDQGVSENVRAEALGHGVILELELFANLAADAQLPEEMAENLLHHVMNENRDPALQIRTYKDFLNHSSPEIREKARETLAFILEDDFGKADEAALLQKADAKLKLIEEEKLKQSGAEEKPPEE
jgi:hypothetical protein